MPEIVKRVELDNIGFDVGNDPSTKGQIALRWRKLTYVDGKLEASEPHRTMIDADMTEDQVTAHLETVAKDLENQGFGRPPPNNKNYIDAVKNLAWTPEIKAATKKAKEEQFAKLEAQAEAQRASKAAEDEARQKAEEARFAEWAQRAGMVPRTGK
jgi:hypothetical protein